MELLLASASPSRKRLLEQACIPHRVQVSGIDEEAIQHADPLQLVQDLAIAKAKAVPFTKIGHKTLVKVFIAHGDKKLRYCHKPCDPTYQA